MSKNSKKLNMLIRFYLQSEKRSSENNRIRQKKEETITSKDETNESDSNYSLII